MRFASRQGLAKARPELNASNFEFELGWVYVHPSARGHRLASSLVQELLSRLKGTAIYATCRVDNTRMHASLFRAGFRQAGTPYPSKINDPELRLFVRS
ncbi:MAG: GNAT family N-acetyltransferase [Rudaea sp.]|nr:GNAT family N-acetyltransferase [Rudaea sp.]